jgi:hypothetical protein
VLVGVLVAVGVLVSVGVLVAVSTGKGRHVPMAERSTRSSSEVVYATATVALPAVLNEIL